MNIRPLLRLVCQRFFGEFTSELCAVVSTLRDESPFTSFLNVLLRPLFLLPSPPFPPTHFTFLLLFPHFLSFQALWTCVSNTFPLL